MTRRISHELLIAAAVLFAAFVALALWVRFHGPLPGDGRAHGWAVAHRAPGQRTYDFCNVFGALGTGPGALLTTVTAAVILLRNVSARAAGMLLAAAAITLVEPRLAGFVGTTDSALALGFPAEGFPSGHVLYAAAVLGMLAWLGRAHGRPEVTSVCLVAIVLMGLTRVLSGVHLPSDVLGGYLLGGAWLSLVLGVTRAVGRA